MFFCPVVRNVIALFPIIAVTTLTKTTAVSTGSKRSRSYFVRSIVKQSTPNKNTIGISNTGTLLTTFISSSCSCSCSSSSTRRRSVVYNSLPVTTNQRTKTPQLSSSSLVKATTRKMSTGNTNIAAEAVTIRHAPDNLIPSTWKMMKERTRIVTNQEEICGMSASPGGCIVYWMQRDVRTEDNWALLWSAYLAKQYNVPLRVIYVLQPPPPPPSPSPVIQSNDDNDIEHVPNLQNLRMTIRHGKFLLGGLQQVYEQLKQLNIPLHVLMADSNDTVGQTVCTEVCHKLNTIAIICDMNPIRQYRQWIEQQLVIQLLNIQQQYKHIPCYQVDAHNVIPVWISSMKREYGARTIRLKISKIIDQYLIPYPKQTLSEIIQSNTNIQSSATNILLPEFDIDTYENYLQMDTSVNELDWAKPGTIAAWEQYTTFTKVGLNKFSMLRNDPNQNTICSNLSPWINHGHISFQSIAYHCKTNYRNIYSTGVLSYLEEGIIRRELSDNFVYYSPNDYDKVSCTADWAQLTLQLHTNDIREYVYTIKELELCCTHDDLWNAAQMQAKINGKMHGFLRMYWAKKILEWTLSPTIALQYGHYLNDKYNIDGRDPNGFVGVNWSILGIHDQGWAERPIFGKIRYMNYAGCKRKFDVKGFVARYQGAAENAIQAEQKHLSTKKVETNSTVVSKVSTKAAKTTKVSNPTSTTTTTKRKKIQSEEVPAPVLEAVKSKSSSNSRLTKKLATGNKKK